MKKILWLCMIIIFLITLTGCQKYENEYYEMEFTSDGNSLIISSLKKVIDSDVLYIPMKVDNYDVIAISNRGWGTLVPIKKDLIVGVKRYYVPGSIERIVATFFDNVDSDSKIFYCGKVRDVFLFNIKSKYNDEIRTYVPLEFYDEFVEETSEVYRDRVLKANVSYHLNYGEYDYYYIDYYESGEKIKYIPPVPTRDEYEFVGWFVEEECINEWNFDLNLVNISDEIQEIRLYAKWHKVK